MYKGRYSDWFNSTDTQDGKPRIKWLLGLVTELYPGKDKVVPVKLKTTNGTLVRSI